MYQKLPNISHVHFRVFMTPSTDSSVSRAAPMVRVGPHPGMSVHLRISPLLRDKSGRESTGVAGGGRTFGNGLVEGSMWVIWTTPLWESVGERDPSSGDSSLVHIGSMCGGVATIWLQWRERGGAVLQRVRGDDDGLRWFYWKCAWEHIVYLVNLHQQWRTLGAVHVASVSKRRTCSTRCVC